jgi:hypothetical protein
MTYNFSVLIIPSIFTKIHTKHHLGFNTVVYEEVWVPTQISHCNKYNVSVTTIDEAWLLRIMKPTTSVCLPVKYRNVSLPQNTLLYLTSCNL